MLRPRLFCYSASAIMVGMAVIAVTGPYGNCPEAENIDWPAVHDERLELTLFAEDPDIVTPIGLAVDERDRVFVLESHTHMPPSGYEGPSSDRVKIFEDRTGDGRADEISVFAEGIEDGMNLAFSPGGVLHVVTSQGVWALHDEDGDGRSESRNRVLHLAEPDDAYDHAALLGIAFSHDGWMYVARGNTGSQPWRLEGTDDSFLSGYGDGGNIVRARPDGSQLEEVATGFWNPFDLTFDGKGRLLAADNDPDSRGPNRLVHIVPGGDYGYKSLYGGSGIHPYLAWNGELPGTLPFAAPLGEAPSGLLDARLAALPADYDDAMLATIWEESVISRVDLAEQGTSLSGEATPLIEGGDDFRPVALDADSEGAVYITDWVLRTYPNHGRGRIWRLATRPGEGVTAPQEPYARPEPADEQETLEQLYRAGAGDIEQLKEALASDDPFVRTAAVTALARPDLRDDAAQLTHDSDPELRLGALLALRRAEHENAAPIARRLLEDPDPQVRRMALVWIGRQTMTSLRPDLEKALIVDKPSPELFETYLATIRHLTPSFVEAYRSRAKAYANQIERSLPAGFLNSFVKNTSHPPTLRAIALRHLEVSEDDVRLLMRILKERDTSLQIEVVRSLAGARSEEAGRMLADLAQDTSRPDALRAEALLALSRQPGGYAETAAALLNDPAPAVRLEAARYLRSRPPNGAVRAQVEEAYAALRTQTDRQAAAEQLAFVFDPSAHSADRPTSDEAWQKALAQGGRPDVGRRVFFSVQAQCAQCHATGGRGGDLGPDLTNVGRSKSRQQLIRAIIDPSAEIAPEWQGWYVETEDGQVHHGRQIDVGYDDFETYTTDGAFAAFEDVADYGTMDASLMPEGLESQLTVSDLRHLVAFLEQTE